MKRRLYLLATLAFVGLILTLRPAGMGRKPSGKAPDGQILTAIAAATAVPAAKTTDQPGGKAAPGEPEFVADPSTGPAANPPPRSPFEQPSTTAGHFGVRPSAEEQAEQQRQQMEDLRKRRAAVEAWAKARGAAVSGYLADGAGFELIDVEGDVPVYQSTNNTNAAISNNSWHLRKTLLTPLGPWDGAGWTVGLWEKGSPRLTHEQFFINGGFSGVFFDTGTFELDSTLPNQSHATHVLGTLIGRGGLQFNATGMAPAATARCYHWAHTSRDIKDEGATRPGEPGKLYVSNHSYGRVAGWANFTSDDPGPSGHAGWNWIGTGGESESFIFGTYDSKSKSFDQAVVAAPYHLPFFAAGNATGSVPGFDVTFPSIYWPNGSGGWNSGTFIVGMPAGAPEKNGGDSGFDTLLSYGSSKNVITVGNLSDAVSGTTRQPNVPLVASSSVGPADDGRIKPDIVANGESVYSADKDSDSSYGNKTGTSMASPSACGASVLIHQKYTQDTQGQYLRASTLKGLIIHTATDISIPGPDYYTGWGLMDTAEAMAQIDRHVASPASRRILEDSLSETTPEYRFTFKAQPGVPIKATLCWTDQAGAINGVWDSRTPALVNDLDMTIQAPGGTLYRAPALDYNIPALPARFLGNSVDNVEKLGGTGQNIAYEPGIYELIIRHKGTLQPLNTEQDFSLILQGNDNVNTGTLADAVDQSSRLFSAAGTRTFGYEYDTSAVGTDRASSLPVTHNQKSIFETVVTGPTTITFRWGVSSESGFDFLRLYDQGVEVTKISGEVATTSYSYAVPAGARQLRWEYSKDGSDSAGQDRGWVDDIQFNNIGEGVDLNTLAYTQPAGSNAGWNTIPNASVPTNDIAQSGAINPGQTSAFETIIQGPAVVRFRMVQTGTGSLRAQVASTNGANILHTTGTTWNRQAIYLQSGPQTVRWSFIRTTAAAGTGYVDELEILPMASTLEVAANLRPSDYALQPVSAYAAWLAKSGPSAPTQNGDNLYLSTTWAENQPADSAIVYSVAGPGTVSFWWGVEGPSNHGLYVVETRLNSTGAYGPAGSGRRAIPSLTGGQGWRQEHIEVPAGITDIRFTFTRSPLVTLGLLDQITFQPGLTQPARGLDCWSTRWTSTGNAAWGSIPDESRGGLDSITHGPLADNQSTQLTTSVTGPRKLFFQWKVSSEPGYDKLRFTVNGQEVLPPISGERPWHGEVVDIPAGPATLRWTYSKDGSEADGQDRGWVDGVALLRPDFGITKVTPLNGTAAVVIAVKDPLPGIFLDRSPDLSSWSSTPLTPSQANLSIVAAAFGPRSYYRLRFEPEMVHTIENAGFEQPVTTPDSFQNNGPGWGPDNDAFTANSFENIVGFVHSGSQHLSLAAGAFVEMKTTASSYPGMISATAWIGHRSGFTGTTNLTSLAISSGPELARSSENAFPLPVGTWKQLWPATYELIDADANSTYAIKIRLEGTGSRSHFDDVRLATESQ